MIVIVCLFCYAYIAERKSAILRKERFIMEYENKYASKGVAGTALGISIGAGVLGLMNNGNGLGGILGNGGNCHPENMAVNRYEAGMSARIAELETEVKLRDSNIYTDSKILDLYKYFDGETKEIRATLAAQAVHNQKTADAFDSVRNDIICVKNELYSAIARERDERCCGDNAIVTYANATFYPKMVADVTVGTTTTAQNVYNPLPNCGRCGC